MSAQPAPGGQADAPAGRAAVLLEVKDLSKRFGGLVATEAVSLRVRAGEIHALIGPNGAGKTTLVAQLGGQLPSDSGSVHFDGADITRLVAHQRARRGLVRSFQVTRVFKSLSVLDNVALAVQAVRGGTFSAWRAVRSDHSLYERAMQVLAGVNLADKAGLDVAQLAHGEQRALEVGMTLASRPRLVLLDEPLAGMGAQESEAMARLIAGLRQHCAVLLIEHDVDAVFRLADTVSVLVGGRLVASGVPGVVRRDPAVLAAYLGDAEDMS